MPKGAREHHLWTPLARGLIAVGDRWTLLIVSTLAPEPLRLNQLHRRLPGVSAGVLGRHLQRTVDLGLVVRQRYKEMPPRVEYRLTAAGEELVPAAVQIARWGIRYMWSAPHPREHVAIGQILGLLPAMLAGERLPGELPDGVLELVVQEPRGRERHLFEVRAGSLRATRPDSGEPAVRMVGAPDAWVRALGPDRDRAALRITGDPALARRLLGALPTWGTPAQSAPAPGRAGQVHAGSDRAGQALATFGHAGQAHAGSCDACSDPGPDRQAALITPARAAM